MTKEMKKSTFRTKHEVLIYLRSQKGDRMKKQKKIISIFLVALCTIFIVLASGCTYNNPSQQENNQATPTESVTAETTQSESTQPTVSWKDFYPDHTEQEKSELIEKAKGKIMSTFPDVDRSTLNGIWVEHTRITDNGIEEIGKPYIKFENIKSTSDDGKYAISVDPESMELTYYSPYRGEYSEPVISFNEAKEKAIDFIKETQGDDSIANDTDVYIHTVNEADEEYGRPIASVYIFKKHEGITYMSNYVMAEYDMSKGNIERYSDNMANSELLSGLTTLSPEPEITFDEAVKIAEDKIAEKYDLDEIDLEYSELIPFDTYLLWLDYDDVIYADNPEPVPLVWSAELSDKEAREEALYMDDEDYIKPFSGGFIIDAHTGEIYSLRYGDIRI